VLGHVSVSDDVEARTMDTVPTCAGRADADETPTDKTIRGTRQSRDTIRGGYIKLRYPYLSDMGSETV